MTSPKPPDRPPERPLDPAVSSAAVYHYRLQIVATRDVDLFARTDQEVEETVSKLVEATTTDEWQLNALAVQQKTRVQVS